MNKKLLIVPLFTLLAVAPAHAFWNFGFSFGDPRPVCVTRVAPVVSVAPVAHVGFGVPVSDCGPSIGLGFSIPLVSRDVCLDDANCSYWKIYNDTDMLVRVTNRSGDSKVIKPGEHRRLSHASSFKLKIRVDGMERSVRSQSHRLSISLDDCDNICVDTE